MAKSVSHSVSPLDQYQLSELILVFRGDTSCDTDFAIYYSIYVILYLYLSKDKHENTQYDSV